MQMRIMTVLTATAILVNSNALASLVGVDVIPSPFQNPDGLHNTWRIVARFSDPMDKISAVNGVSGVGFNAITFSIQRGVLYNQPQFEGLSINDFPSASIGGEPWDTYVTIGATDFPHNIQFSPGFLSDGDVPPKQSVIQGCNFEEDDGAWFYFGSPPTVGQFDSQGGNDTYDVVIAQLTIFPFSDLHFGGNLQWFSAEGGGFNTPFLVANISGPGPLADLNGDWSVNTPDLLLLLAAWGPTNYDTGSDFCPAPPDYNDDGIVDIIDLQFLLDNWEVVDWN